MTAVATPQRQLRVAWLWNETLQGEKLLLEPEAVDVGDEGIFPLPENLVDDPTIPLLIPKGAGYTLSIDSRLGGDVWLNGQRTPVASLGTSVDLGPNDYGVVTLGPVAYFFQFVRGAAPGAPKDAIDYDIPLLMSLLLAALLAISVLVIAWLDWTWRGGDSRDPFELDSELITQFMVTPPPEDLFEQEFAPESGTETEDPGLRAREEASGTAHEDEEGRVGHEDADQEDTEIEGEVDQAIVAKVRNMGLLGALSGGEGNAIAAALDVPDISDILGGTGAAVTRAGRGSRGAGLRGLGMGGGGDGPGSLFGAGNLGTGIGAGMGSGVGRGMGGVGARGRKAKEVRIAVSRGRPRVSGYLSAEQINRVVRANQAAVRYCYEVEVQRQPNLRGRVEIRWRINLQGAVTSSGVASSTLRNARVEGCIVRQVRRWRFPRPDGGEVNVTYPFIFGVQGG